MKNNLRVNQRRTTAFRDLLIIVMIASAVFCVSVILNTFERFVNWYQEYGRYKGGEIDEIIIVLIILAFSFAIFSFRRWRELRYEINERKRLEAALEQSAAIVESSDDAIIGKTLEGIILSWNSGAERIYGYTSAEMVGRPISILLPPERPDELSRFLERIKGGEHIDHYETVRVKKDGRLIHVSLMISPVKDTTGKIVGASTIARDITDRKRAEEALRESEERYRTLFEGARDAIYVTTREGEIIDANQSLLDQFGYGREEVIGLNARVTYAHSEDRLKFQEEIEREGFVKDYETKLRKKDGTEMECLLTSIVRRNADGYIVGYQGIIRDITERKRAEEERETLIHELQDALANIRRLRGLLPICASCKKIRDDKGYWNQLETFIQEHSEAEFSHGFCPDCMKKLYGVVLEDDTHSKKQ
jgi:PAS domain S-box-containing protein